LTKKRSWGAHSH